MAFCKFIKHSAMIHKIYKKSIIDVHFIIHAKSKSEFSTAEITKYITGLTASVLHCVANGSQSFHLNY